MKIAISCVSPLVQRSLSFFLKEYCVDEEESDFIISDDENKQSKKPLCLIIDEAHSHIRKPFSAESLYEDIRAFYEKLQYSHNHKTDSIKIRDMKSFHPSMSPPNYPQRDMSECIRDICMKNAENLANEIISLLKV